MKLSIITINYNNKAGLENTIAGLIGRILVDVVFWTLFISSAIFMLGISMQSWIFPTAVMIGCISVLRYSSLRQSLKAIGISLGIILISLMIATNLYDYSYDGLAYHQKSIYYLMHGWDPNYETCPEDTPCHLIWVNHYAKGLEYIASAISSFTGNIESGKAVNFILLTSLFFFAYDTLRHSLSKTNAIITGTLIAYPAIALTQILTYYIDWSLYFIVALAIISLYNLHRNDSKLELILIGELIIFAISIKFNYIFWIGIILLIYACMLIYERKWLQIRKGVVISLISIVLAYVVISYNPYITNILSGHSLFYPLTGSGSTDIMTGNTPLALQDYNYFEKVLVSLASAPSNDDCIFASFLCDFQNLRSCDSRIGGFGPYFFWICIYTIIATCICWFRRERNIKIVIFSEIGLFVSLFILPSGWWARYVAFFALFPLPVIILLLESRNCRLLNYGLIMLLLLNDIITIAASFDTSLIQTQRTKYFLSVLSNSPNCHINCSANEGFRFKTKDLNLPLIYTTDSKYMTLQLPINGPKVVVCDVEFRRDGAVAPHFMDGIYDKFSK